MHGTIIIAINCDEMLASTLQTRNDIAQAHPLAGDFIHSCRALECCSRYGRAGSANAVSALPDGTSRYWRPSTMYVVPAVERIGTPNW